METGQYIQDGTVKWIVADVRDGHEVGEIIFCDHLKDGYIKANGATVTASDYPRLTAYVVANNLTGNDDAHYQYDSVNDELTLPNVMDRVLQGGNAVESKEAGLPNIEGSLQFGDGGSGGRSGLTGYSSDGALYGETAWSNTYPSGASQYPTYKYGKLDASRSSQIYGNSDTVQPPAIVMIPQIKY